MSAQGLRNNELAQVLALSLPLLVRFYRDGMDAAPQRLGLLLLVFGIAYAWNAVFKRQAWQYPTAYQLHFAMLFALLLPGPVGWGGTLLAASFGWVFGHEIFGGRSVFPPALIAVTFAIFSFPQGGFELQWVLSAPLDPLLALACLPGAIWLMWKKAISWPVVVGASLGVVLATELVSSSLPWPDHFVLGTFSVGILFVAAQQDCAPRTMRACWLYGILIGALVVSIRLANPDQPDGLMFVILLGALFAPLLDRLLSWGKYDA